MSKAKITSKGQVTIPKGVRQRLRWKTGDRPHFTADSSGRVIVELVTGDLHELAGLLHRPDQNGLGGGDERGDPARGRRRLRPDHGPPAVIGVEINVLVRYLT